MGGAPSPDRLLPERLRPVLDECVSGHGMDLEEVEIASSGNRRVLRVAVDQDGGVGLDDIAEVSRTVSAALDAADVSVGPAYTLEVTSRGTDRPLLAPRHWRRNTERLVRVTLDDGTGIQGRIVAATDDGATIATDDGVREIAYTDVRKARVQVELK